MILEDIVLFISDIFLESLMLSISGKQYANDNTTSGLKPNPRQCDMMFWGKNSCHDKHAKTKSCKHAASPFTTWIKKPQF